MYQTIQEVSTEITIFMTVAKSMAQTDTCFFLHHLIESVIFSTTHGSQLGTMFSIIYKLKVPI